MDRGIEIESKMKDGVAIAVRYLFYFTEGGRERERVVQIEKLERDR